MGKLKNKGVLRASRSAKQKKPEKELRISRFPACGFTGCHKCGFVKAVRLGAFHSFPAVLVAPRHPHPTTLHVGCRRFTSPTDAREHWKHGVNRDGEARPRSRELIAKASAAAKLLGARWARPRRANNEGA